jgi:hypothetical protein
VVAYNGLKGMRPVWMAGRIFIKNFLWIKKMSINFSGYVFSDPILLINWNPPYKAGIYAILKYDSSCNPKPYRVLYFGQSGNMSERGFSSHHARSCWIRNAGSEDKLYIATYLIPNSTEPERLKVESKLIEDYQPVCNR